MIKKMSNRAPSNIKFRLLSPETFIETIDLMINHFFPREPVSSCLEDLHYKLYPGIDPSVLEFERRGWLAHVLRFCPTTIIAQDSKNDDKVVGAVIAGVGRRNTKLGPVEEWYDMEISNEELIQTWSARNLELLGMRNDRIFTLSRYEIDIT